LGDRARVTPALDSSRCSHARLKGGVEERDAAIVANMLGLPAKGGVYVGAADTPASRSEVLGALKPYLVQASGMRDDAAVTK
jgi:hypothetical protein